MKVVINTCFGGFGLSPEAVRMLHQMGCKHVEVMTPSKYYGKGWQKKFKEDKVRPRGHGPIIEGGSILVENVSHPKFIDDNYEEYDYSARCDPMVIEVVEKLKDGANGNFADLKIVEIPDDVKWTIENYDGTETIHEVHRSWG